MYMSCITLQSEIEVAKYGKNERSVRDAIAEQELKANMIEEYRKHVDAVVKKVRLHLIQ